MKRIALSVALLCAGSVQAADLLGIYQDARQSDAKYGAARYQVEAGREKLPQGRAGLLPTINLNGASTYNNLDAKLPNEREYGYNTNSYTLQLSQPLFRWQNWVAYKQGELQVGVAEAQLTAAELDLMVRSTQAYFDLLNAQDVLTVQSQLKKASREQLDLSKKSFEVGTVTITDVNDAQSKYDIVSAQEIAAQNDVNVKREALRVLIAKEPPQLARLRDGVMLEPPMPADVEQWALSAQKNNLDVQVGQLNAEIAAREVERTRAAHMPTIDAVGSYGRNHGAGSTSSQSEFEYRNWQIGVQATLPIFAGGGTQSKVRESQALSAKSQQDLEAAKRNAAQLARSAFLSVTSGVAQVRGYEAAVVSSRSALESNKLGYQVGVKINKDVLDAQSQLADTAQKLAKSRYDTIMAQVKLKQAVGSLSLKDLEEINALLER